MNCVNDVIYFSAVNINYLLYTCYFYIYLPTRTII